jgi:DNA-binding GntR family transcriptional regulator
MVQETAAAVVGTRVERPRSLTALVTDQLRDLIVTGRLALGEQLSENALAERLGVSRTPVREAFLRLEAERLVEVRPQRGTFVFRVDADEVREICELREVLETGALRIALARDPAALAAALSPLVEAASAAAFRDPAAYQPHDAAFHETLVAAGRNRQLAEAYGLISARVTALRYRFLTTPAQVEGSRGQHAEVLRLVRAGDATAAEEALRHHVYNSYRALLDLVGGGDDAPAGEAASP